MTEVEVLTNISYTLARIAILFAVCMVLLGLFVANYIARGK